MNITELRAELCVLNIELEKALDKGLPHSEIIKIYRDIKDLQYHIALAELKDQTQEFQDPTIIE